MMQGRKRKLYTFKEFVESPSAKEFQQKRKSPSLASSARGKKFLRQLDLAFDQCDNMKQARKKSPEKKQMELNPPIVEKSVNISKKSHKKVSFAIGSQSTETLAFLTQKDPSRESQNGSHDNQSLPTPTKLTPLEDNLNKAATRSDKQEMDQMKSKGRKKFKQTKLWFGERGFNHKKYVRACRKHRPNYSLSSQTLRCIEQSQSQNKNNSHRKKKGASQSNQSQQSQNSTQPIKLQESSLLSKQSASQKRTFHDHSGFQSKSVDTECKKKKSLRKLSGIASKSQDHAQRKTSQGSQQESWTKPVQEQHGSRSKSVNKKGKKVKKSGSSNSCDVTQTRRHSRVDVFNRTVLDSDTRYHSKTKGNSENFVKKAGIAPILDQTGSQDDLPLDDSQKSFPEFENHTIVETSQQRLSEYGSGIHRKDGRTVEIFARTTGMFNRARSKGDTQLDNSQVPFLGSQNSFIADASQQQLSECESGSLREAGRDAKNRQTESQGNTDSQESLLESQMLDSQGFLVPEKVTKVDSGEEDEREDRLETIVEETEEDIRLEKSVDDKDTVGKDDNKGETSDNDETYIDEEMLEDTCKTPSRTGHDEEEDFLSSLPSTGPFNVVTNGCGDKLSKNTLDPQNCVQIMWGCEEVHKISPLSSKDDDINKSSMDQDKGLSSEMGRSSMRRTRDVNFDRKENTKYLSGDEVEENSGAFSTTKTIHQAKVLFVNDNTNHRTDTVSTIKESRKCNTVDVEKGSRKNFGSAHDQGAVLVSSEGEDGEQMSGNGHQESRRTCFSKRKLKFTDTGESVDGNMDVENLSVGVSEVEKTSLLTANIAKDMDVLVEETEMFDDSMRDGLIGRGVTVVPESMDMEVDRNISCIFTSTSDEEFDMMVNSAVDKCLQQLKSVSTGSGGINEDAPGENTINHGDRQLSHGRVIHRREESQKTSATAEISTKGQQAQSRFNDSQNMLSSKASKSAAHLSSHKVSQNSYTPPKTISVSVQTDITVLNDSDLNSAFDFYQNAKEFVANYERELGISGSSQSTESASDSHYWEGTFARNLGGTTWAGTSEPLAAEGSRTRKKRAGEMFVDSNGIWTRQKVKKLSRSERIKKKRRKLERRMKKLLHKGEGFVGQEYSMNVKQGNEVTEDLSDPPETDMDEANRLFNGSFDEFGNIVDISGTLDVDGRVSSKAITRPDVSEAKTSALVAVIQGASEVVNGKQPMHRKEELSRSEVEGKQMQSQRSNKKMTRTVHGDTTNGADDSNLERPVTSIGSTDQGIHEPDMLDESETGTVKESRAGTSTELMDKLRSLSKTKNDSPNRRRESDESAIEEVAYVEDKDDDRQNDAVQPENGEETDISSVVSQEPLRMPDTSSVFDLPVESDIPGPDELYVLAVKKMFGGKKKKSKKTKKKTKTKHHKLHSKHLDISFSWDKLKDNDVGAVEKVTEVPELPMRDSQKQTSPTSSDIDSVYNYNILYQKEKWARRMSRRLSRKAKVSYVDDLSESSGDRTGSLLNQEKEGHEKEEERQDVDEMGMGLPDEPKRFQPPSVIDLEESESETDSDFDFIWEVSDESEGEDAFVDFTSLPDVFATTPQQPMKSHSSAVFVDSTSLPDISVTKLQL